MRIWLCVNWCIGIFVWLLVMCVLVHWLIEYWQLRIDYCLVVYWLVATGYWLLVMVVGRWLWVIDCWLVVGLVLMGLLMIGYSLLIIHDW